MWVWMRMSCTNNWQFDFSGSCCQSDQEELPGNSEFQVFWFLPRQFLRDFPE
jgi:hypothetical protein